MKTLAAVAIADVHLSVTPPSFRSEEPNWLKKQKEALEEVFLAANNNGNPVPLLIPGDLFNIATPAPEIINFALDVFVNLPFSVYAIPGNHDLPHHRYEDMDKSAYGILVKAGRIKTIRAGECVLYRSTCMLRLHGWPCGSKVQPNTLEQSAGHLDIALVHDYIWTSKCSFAGAPNDQHWMGYKEKLKGYQVAVFGDNHLGFCSSRIMPNECSLLNCGTLLTRKRDEISNTPSCGLIYSDGSVERRPLASAASAVFSKALAEEKEEEVIQPEEKEALEAFASLEEQSVNFGEFLRHLAERKNIRLRVKELILESLERK